MVARNARSLVIVSALIGQGAVAAFLGCSAFTAAEDQTSGDAGGGPGDSGSGEADVTADAASPFCPRFASAAFCADFDDGKPLASTWSRLEPEVESLRPIIDSTTSVSGGFSLAAKVGPLRDRESSGSVVVKALASTPPSRAHYEFAMRLGAIDGTKAAYLAELVFGSGDYATRYRVWLYVSDRIGYLAQQAPFAGPAAPSPARTIFTKDLKIERWQRITIDVDFAKGTVSATLDGLAAATAPILDGGISGPPTISAGISYAEGPQGLIDVRYDDVLLTVE